MNQDHRVSYGIALLRVGGWEYPLYLSLLAAAQVLLGDGAFALSRILKQPVRGERQPIAV
jgi:hypothetical protein